MLGERPNHTDPWMPPYWEVNSKSVSRRDFSAFQETPQTPWGIYSVVNRLKGWQRDLDLIFCRSLIVWLCCRVTSKNFKSCCDSICFSWYCFVWHWSSIYWCWGLAPQVNFLAYILRLPLCIELLMFPVLLIRTCLLDFINFEINILLPLVILIILSKITCIFN